MSLTLSRHLVFIFVRVRVKLSLRITYYAHVALLGLGV